MEDKTIFMSTKRGKLTKDQFHKFFNRDFKRSIVQSKIPKGEKLLVAYSGGDSSSALLHLLGKLIPDSKKNPKRFERETKFKYVISVLHIDTKELFLKLNSNLEDKKEEKISIEEEIKTIYNESVDSIHVDKKSFCEGSENFETIKSFKKDLSAMEDAYNILLEKEINKYAVNHGFKYLLLGTSSTRIAAKFISQICKGSPGNQTFATRQIKVNTDNKKEEELNVIQPMRGFLEEEIKFYNETELPNRINRVIGNFASNRSLHSSTIDNLIDHHIAKISIKKKDSIPTILKTADKLKFDAPKRSCTFCHKQECLEGEDLCYSCFANFRIKENTK